MKNYLLLLLIAALTLTEGMAASIFNPVDTFLYPDNMTMVVRLTDGDTVVDTCEVAAFVGGECRGAARAILPSSGDSKGALYYLMIAGQGGGQPMELRTCLNGEIVTIDNTLQYVSDGSVGTPWEPYVIDLHKLMTGGVKGDIDGDGLVTIADVAAVITFISSPPALSAPSENSSQGMMKPEDAVDVNGDGKVDIADILAIINMMM